MIFILPVVRLRKPRIKVFHIQQIGFAKSLSAPLDEPKLLFQFIQQFDRLLSGTMNRVHDFLYRADNVGVAVLVLPAVLNGKAHTVKQHSIQQLGIPGHLLEQISLDQCLRHTVKAVSVCFQTFEIRVLHVNSSPPIRIGFALLEITVHSCGGTRFHAPPQCICCYLSLPFCPSPFLPHISAAFSLVRRAGCTFSARSISLGWLIQLSRSFVRYSSL